MNNIVLLWLTGTSGVKFHHVSFIIICCIKALGLQSGLHTTEKGNTPQYFTIVENIHA